MSPYRMVPRISGMMVLVGLLSVAGAHAQRRTGRVTADPEAPGVGRALPADATTLRVMKFSGLLQDPIGNPRTGTVGLTFAFYKEQQGGAPLWMEVQNAELDEQGRYTVLLGSTQAEGLPLDLFSSGEARWLGVELHLPGAEEEQRVLLVSVPYAFKAADADTLGGKPVSAFLLAEGQGGTAGRADSLSAQNRAGPSQLALSTGVLPVRDIMTANHIPKFLDGLGTLGDSIIYEDLGKIGIGTTTPAGTFQVRKDQNATTVT